MHVPYLTIYFKGSYRHVYDKVKFDMAAHLDDAQSNVSVPPRVVEAKLDILGLVGVKDGALVLSVDPLDAIVVCWWRLSNT